ncbi:hypothetical protein [Amphibacillus sediminis]|uniref:hypothetical protein n=1 Tax=Amphibacillus sediminis TaxID=360185 RepID=UPI00082BE391|nr:hypothetical protein [Amphibacillus sediminis]
MSEQHDDQANLLRQQVASIQNEVQIQDENEAYDPEDQELDVLNLPPRSEVHDAQSAKVRWKVSYSLIRLLVVFFILIVILILTFNYWGDYFLQNELFSQVRTTNQVGDSVHIVRLSDTLSEEVTRKFQLDPSEPELTSITGRYYITQEDDTLESVMSRFYQNEQVLPLLKQLNDLTISPTDRFEANERLFLPNIRID